MASWDTYLPSDEELTVQEINMTSAFLKAGSFHFGKACETISNEFMLCQSEEKDPRKCVVPGKAVTACALKFFQEVKRNCAEEFHRYGTCIDKTLMMEYNGCRDTQAHFDACMLNKMGMKRPSYGYLTEARIHKTARPKPIPEGPAVYPDAMVDVPPDDIPRHPARFGSRFHFWH